MGKGQPASGTLASPQADEIEAQHDDAGEAEGLGDVGGGQDFAAGEAMGEEGAARLRAGPAGRPVVGPGHWGKGFTQGGNRGCLRRNFPDFSIDYLGFAGDFPAAIRGCRRPMRASRSTSAKMRMQPLQAHLRGGGDRSADPLPQDRLPSHLGPRFQCPPRAPSRRNALRRLCVACDRQEFTINWTNRGNLLPAIRTEDLPDKEEVFCPCSATR